MVRQEPALRPLALVMKHYLYQWGLHEPGSGGLGSYALVLMLIRSLQCQRQGKAGADVGTMPSSVPPVYGNETSDPIGTWQRPEERLDMALLYFLRMYGYGIKPGEGLDLSLQLEPHVAKVAHEADSVLPEGPAPDQEQGMWYVWDPLRKGKCIDVCHGLLYSSFMPIGNNVACALRRQSALQGSFRKAYLRLLRAMNTDDVASDTPRTDLPGPITTASPPDLSYPSLRKALFHASPKSQRQRDYARQLAASSWSHVSDLFYPDARSEEDLYAAFSRDMACHGYTNLADLNPFLPDPVGGGDDAN